MQHGHILKKFYFGLGSTPKSTQRARTQGFKLKSHLICFISIAALPACKISAKNINNCLSYCEIKIYDLWPLRWGQRRWGKTLTLQCLSTGTWQPWSIVRSEKLLNIIALMKCEDHHTKKLIQWATLVAHRFLRAHIFSSKMLESNILYENLLIDIFLCDGIEKNNGITHGNHSITSKAILTKTHVQYMPY